MGLFDFLKKSSETTNKSKSNTAPSENELFVHLNKYGSYLTQFISMQTQGNFAPISAYEKQNGELVGLVYVMGEDQSYNLGAEEAVLRMTERFEEQIEKKEIRSYVVLYHSPFDGQNNDLSVADHENDFRAITLAYHFDNEFKGKIGLPYSYEGNTFTIGGFSEFSKEENDALIQSKLEEGKDYFTDRIKITPPVYTNKSCIRIKECNTLNLSNTWCGIFGFETYRKPESSDILRDYFPKVLAEGKPVTKGNITTVELHFQDISFKAITKDQLGMSILPEVKTDYSLDFETKEIEEWENVEGLEAIVSGSARNTFGLWFFATDYAENQERYRTEKNLQVHISGIAFVLDLHKEEASKGELTYSDQFTSYMPNQNLPNYGCFDFIGQLENYRETSVMEDKSVKGYLLNVRLITHEEQKDFFTIDIFVHPENMRFTELEVGMKLTGMFQMQGKIANNPPNQPET